MLALSLNDGPFNQIARLRSAVPAAWSGAQKQSALRAVRPVSAPCKDSKNSEVRLSASDNLLTIHFDDYLFGGLSTQF